MRYITSLILAATLSIPSVAQIDITPDSEKKVQRSELQSKQKEGRKGERPSPDELFGKIDKDQDGVLSKHEFLNFHEKMKARKDKKRKQKGEKRKDGGKNKENVKSVEVGNPQS